ncbi:hypothetical protein M422DRAFT_248783 [Sphaerobolus stellatus SS14]|nr:hypothetical protein M422DRAFT_248783 [Sphaerobolus stellatus SS14]
MQRTDKLTVEAITAALVEEEGHQKAKEIQGSTVTAYKAFVRSQSRQSSSSPIVCHRCEETGHIARNCTAAKPKSASVPKKTTDAVANVAFHESPPIQLF